MEIIKNSFKMLYTQEEVYVFRQKRTQKFCQWKLKFQVKYKAYIFFYTLEEDQYETMHHYIFLKNLKHDKEIPTQTKRRSCWTELSYW